MSRERLRAARQDLHMTQQQVADKLGIGLRHYKKIEKGETLGSIQLWDILEDLTGIHQRILRETSESCPGQEDSQWKC